MQGTSSCQMFWRLVGCRRDVKVQILWLVVLIDDIGEMISRVHAAVTNAQLASDLYASPEDKMCICGAVWDNTTRMARLTDWLCRRRRGLRVSSPWLGSALRCS